MINREINIIKHDIYKDLYFFNIARHEDIKMIKKINNVYMIRFGDMCYKLNATNIKEVEYFLNNIDNRLNIIPLIDNEGNRLGLFYLSDKDGFIFIRQSNTSKEVGE